MKLTEWFDRSQKPILPGVYQVYSHEITSEKYSYWDGTHWHLAGDSKEIAVYVVRKYGPSDSQKWKWRGLAEDPNGRKP